MRRLYHHIMTMLLGAVLAYPTAAQPGDPCGVPAIPLTTHPDRPVYRADLPKHDFDWRLDRWPVYALVRDSARREERLLSIPRPTRDAWTPTGSALATGGWMAPDEGWEFLVAENGVEPDSSLNYEASYVSFIFYNKYTGIVRPMYYYTNVISKPITRYQWEVGVGGNVRNRSVVMRGLDHYAVVYRTPIVRTVNLG